MSDCNLLHPVEEGSYNTSIVTKIAYTQQEIARKIEEFAEIRSGLPGHLVRGEDEDIAGVVGRVIQLADLQIALLIRMERNLFKTQSERMWAPIFEFYLENIETESKFVMNELSVKAKIRSSMSFPPGTDKYRMKALLFGCLSIRSLVQTRSFQQTYILNKVRGNSGHIAPLKSDKETRYVYPSTGLKILMPRCHMFDRPQLKLTKR